MTQMRQVFLLGPQRLEIREVPIPTPGPGELVLRVEVALTCGTDLKTYRRGHHPKIPVPGPFGHEYTGRVARIGSGVQGFREGDAVMGVNTGPCFACTYCHRGLFQHCETLFDDMVIGTYADYVRIPARVVRTNLFLRPPEIPETVAPLIEPLASALHGIQVLRPWQERVLVIGSGPLGILLAFALEAEGNEVTLLGRNPQRNAIARQIGLKHVTDRPPSTQDFDAVVEATGTPEVWQQSLEYLRKGGRVLLFGGLPSTAHVAFPAYALHYEEKHLLGAFHFTPHDVRRAYEFLRQHGERLHPMITGEYPLEQIQEAFHRLDRGEGLKFAIRP